MLSFCRDQKIDLVVVGPEQPLADGIVDQLKGIPVFGPVQAGARIEVSKWRSQNSTKVIDIELLEFM